MNLRKIDEALKADRLANDYHYGVLYAGTEEGRDSCKQAVRTMRLHALKLLTEAFERRVKTA